MQNVAFTAKQLKEIHSLRKMLGLTPLRMGLRNCLKCETQFFSQDLKNNHMCNDCILHPYEEKHPERCKDYVR